jgi:hypothetical protein
METIKAKLINYFDVVGNKEDGFEVNNLCFERNLELENLEDQTILNSLIDCGFFNSQATLKDIEIDDLFPFIEINNASNYYPLCRLEIIED